jgi:carboxymethylenebutenolidase
MGKPIRLTASDGFVLDAWRAEPKTARGALVVIQENAGLTAHIKDVCDSFAEEGYLSVAPALFDRVAKNLVFGYEPSELAARRATRDKVDVQCTLLDVAASIAEVSTDGKVGIIGYCWGGSISWLAAAELPGLSCAVSYYGTGILRLSDKEPKCPMLMHWGSRDPNAPPDEVRKLEAMHPQALSYMYEAGHAFNNPEVDAFDREVVALARKRTLEFFRRHLG